MSYTLAYKGAEIDEILGRAATGGALDTAIAAKQDTLTFDAVPTEGSTNPAESGGIYDAIQAGGAAALAAFATDSVSGDVVSFPDGADGIPVKAFTGSILPAQSGSGDPAPDNIRPISGWTGAELYRTGVNVWDGEWESGLYHPTTGLPSPNANCIRSVNYIPVKAEQDYYVHVGGAGTVVSLGYREDKSYLGSVIANIANGIITTPANCAFLRFYTQGHSTSDASDISINYPSTATTYEAYDGQTIVLSFGQTVYAGTLTALGGGLWQVQPTHARVDMGTLTWTIVASGTAYERYQARGLMGVISAPADNYTIANAICDSLVTATAAHVANGDDAVNELGIYANGIMEVRYPAASTVADFISAMSGVYLVYPLATLPDPITITGEDLQTLLGANTMWTDVGSVTGMTYRADTAIYIQKLIGGGGTLSTLSMASPSPSLSLGRVGVLAEPEEAEPEQTEEEVEQLEQTEERAEEE